MQLYVNYHTLTVSESAIASPLRRLEFVCGDCMPLSIAVMEGRSAIVPPDGSSLVLIIKHEGTTLALVNTFNCVVVEGTGNTYEGVLNLNTTELISALVGRSQILAQAEIVLQSSNGSQRSSSLIPCVITSDIYKGDEAPPAPAICAWMDDVKLVTTTANQVRLIAQQTNTDASSAQSSAVTATTHATSARQSATLASSEVAKIAQHESNAVTAANTAQQSATLATSKATEASQSANTAQSSATSAVISATTATTKANEASTSATTSTIRATEASQSATSAKQEADRATHVLSNAASLTNNNAFAGNQTFNAPVAFNSAVKSSAPICVTNRDNGYCVASSIDMNNIGTQGQSALASMSSVRHVALNYANITIPTDIFVNCKLANGISLRKRVDASVDQTVYHVFGYNIINTSRLNAIMYPSAISMGRGLHVAFEFGNTNYLSNGAVSEPNTGSNNISYGGHSVSGFELGGTPNNLRSYNTSYPTSRVANGFSKVNHRFEKIFTYHELNIFDGGWNTSAYGFFSVVRATNGYVATKGDLYLVLDYGVFIWLCPYSEQFNYNMTWFVKEGSPMGSADVCLSNPIIYQNSTSSILSQLDQMSRFEPNVTNDGDTRRGPATAFEIVVRMCDLKGIPDTALCAATSAVEWATIQQASGTADANIRVRVEANTTGAIRRGYFSVNVVWDDYGHCNFTTYINIEQEA